MKIEALKKLGVKSIPKVSEYPNRALPFHKAMMYADNFEREDVARRLLILGEPGAGKTTF